MKVQPLRGTRDFYPELMRELNAIFKIWREAAESYGYEEVDGPLLEPIELWTLKSGAEIPEQMYRFKDKGDREVAIRPEFTPTLARMVAQKQKTLQKPIKWFTIPRCWRYEAPQSGRLREFFQLNIDCLGTEAMAADAEVIATGVEILRRFGCTAADFYVRLNNRRLITALLKGCSIPDDKMQEVSRLIDKKDKLKAGDFELSLADLGIGGAETGRIKDVLDYRSLNDVDYGSLSEEGKKGYDELKELLKLLETYGLSNYIRLDFSIMRGFDYYTSTVFELFDAKGEFRAIAGGGRYDDLVADFGGEKCPGVGYGMGDVVLALFLKKLGKMPSSERKLDYFIATVNDEMLETAIEIALRLRKKASVETDILGRGFKKQMEYANSIGAKKVIIIGPKDLAEGKATVKDMETGNEEKKKLAEL